MPELYDVWLNKYEQRKTVSQRIVWPLGLKPRLNDAWLDEPTEELHQVKKKRIYKVNLLKRISKPLADPCAMQSL